MWTISKFACMNCIHVHTRETVSIFTHVNCIRVHTHELYPCSHTWTVFLFIHVNCIRVHTRELYPCSHTWTVSMFSFVDTWTISKLACMNCIHVFTKTPYMFTHVNSIRVHAPTISRFPPESRLHTGARVNFVLLTYLLTSQTWPVFINPFATADANMRQYFHCLQWYAGSKRVNEFISVLCSAQCLDEIIIEFH